MRNRGETVGAVDFGSREIRVLIARKDADGTIQVIGHGTAPGRGCVSQGVIQDLNAAQVALKKALAAAEKEARVRVNSLFCGINGKNVETFVREGNVRIDGEIIEPLHLDEARDIASRDILEAGKSIISSLTAREWYVDGLRVIDPVGIRGQVLKVRIHFARVPTVIVDNVVTCVDSQRREVEDIIFLPLAAGLGCLTPEDMELGVAVLDVGRSNTGLAVYRDHRILGTHIIELAGYHLTRDVSAGLQVSFEEADDLILEYGISDEFIRAELDGDRDEDDDEPVLARETESARIKLKTAVHGAPTIAERNDLDMIVCARAKELMAKTRQHLQARGLSKHLVRGVVLTGGSSVIKNQVALAEAVFEVPCRVGMPDSVDIMPQAVNAPSFAAAVGIVRHAFEYRHAALQGHVESASARQGLMKRLGRFFRKWFF